MRGALDFWGWLVGGTLAGAIVLCGPGALVWWLTGEDWTFVALVCIEIVACLTAATWESER